METIADFDAALAAVDAEIAPLRDRRIALHKDREALIDLTVEAGADDAFLMAHADSNTAAFKAFTERVRSLGPAFYSWIRFPVGYDDEGWGPEIPFGPHLTLSYGQKYAHVDFEDTVDGIIAFTMRFVNAGLLDQPSAPRPNMVYCDLIDRDTRGIHKWGIWYTLDFTRAVLVDSARSMHPGEGECVFEGTLVEVLAKAYEKTSQAEPSDDDERW